MIRQLSLFDDYIKQEVFEFGYRDKSLNYTPHYPFVRLDSNNNVTYKKPYCFIFQEKYDDMKKAMKRYNEILADITKNCNDRVCYLKPTNIYIEIPEIVECDGVYGEIEYKKSREGICR